MINRLYYKLYLIHKKIYLLKQLRLHRDSYAERKEWGLALQIHNRIKRVQKL